MRRRAASAASTIRTREAASCSRASTLASAAVTSSAKLPILASVLGRERVWLLAGRHDRAPEAAGDMDRRAHHRAHPELAQPRRQLALNVRVVVHPLGAPRRWSFAVTVSPSTGIRSPTGNAGVPSAAHEPTTVAYRSPS